MVERRIGFVLAVLSAAGLVSILASCGGKPSSPSRGASPFAGTWKMTDATREGKPDLKGARDVLGATLKITKTGATYSVRWRGATSARPAVLKEGKLVKQNPRDEDMTFTVSGDVLTFVWDSEAIGRVEAKYKRQEAAAPSAASSSNPALDLKLRQAVANNNLAAAKSLISRGANVNAGAGTQGTPLHQAAVKGHTEMVKLLLSKGADVNAKTAVGITPLYHVVKWGPQFNKANYRAMAQLLLNKGADVDAKGPYGTTPLHEALLKWDKETVELLLANGADANMKDSTGRTPLQQAAGQPAVADLLRKHGATQ